MSKATDLTYRVVKLPQRLRKQIQNLREEKGMTNEELVAEAVAEELPGIVTGLQNLGFGIHRGKSSNTRLPFSDSAKTLDALRRASQQLRIPAIRLLETCLVMATAPADRRKQRGRGRSSR